VFSTTGSKATPNEIPKGTLIWDITNQTY
jgi:hypothetical protein